MRSSLKEFGSTFTLASVLLVSLMLPGAYARNAYTLGDYYHCTRDEPLVQALAILDHSPMREAVEKIMSHQTRLMFKNMRELGKAYQTHDALSIITESGQHLVFISDRHRDAPPPALAAIIAHEAIHHDTENSIQEEIVGWSREAQAWQHMLSRYPTLKEIPNGKFPLVDRQNAIAVLQQQNRLVDEIQKNVAYKDLPQRSTGF